MDGTEVLSSDGPSEVCPGDLEVPDSVFSRQYFLERVESIVRWFEHEKTWLVMEATVVPVPLCLI